LSLFIGAVITKKLEPFFTKNTIKIFSPPAGEARAGGRGVWGATAPSRLAAGAG